MGMRITRGVKPVDMEGLRRYGGVVVGACLRVSRGGGCSDTQRSSVSAVRRIRAVLAAVSLYSVYCGVR